MRVSPARNAIVALALFAGLATAAADELADFNAAVERASAHNRVALGYLRTGNNELATLELERMREAWADVTHRKRPEQFKDVSQFTTVMTDISMQLVGADMMLKSGRPENAATALAGVRSELSQLRRKNGVAVLADCIIDSNAAAEALLRYDDRTLNWNTPGIASDIAKKTSAYGVVLDRCDGMAAPATRQSPEFRRLVDGVKASLALIPKSIETHDADMLHRILIELRSFDNLLTFRFG
jgi:hypothetical protein